MGKKFWGSDMGSVYKMAHVHPLSTDDDHLKDAIVFEAHMSDIRLNNVLIVERVDVYRYYDTLADQEFKLAVFHSRVSDNRAWGLMKLKNDHNYFATAYCDRIFREDYAGNEGELLFSLTDKTLWQEDNK